MLAEGFYKGKELLSVFLSFEPSWLQSSLKFLHEVSEQETRVSYCPFFSASVSSGFFDWKFNRRWEQN